MSNDYSASVILSDAFSGTLGKLTSGAKAGSQALTQLGTSGGKVADLLAGGFGKMAGAVAGGYAAIKAGEAVYELGRIGAAAETVERSFEHLAQYSGISGDLLLAKMREVSHGTMAETDLMVAANRAMLAGGAALASDLPRLFQIARSASLATGNDIAYVYETLVKGIIRASPLLIDNADIYIKVGQAVTEYASSIGKAESALSAFERQEAVKNAVLKQGAEFMAKTGAESETAAEQFQSMDAAVKNLKTNFGELLVSLGMANAVGGAGNFVDTLARGAKNLRDPDWQEYKKYTDAVEESRKAYVRWIQAQEELDAAKQKKSPVGRFISIKFWEAELRMADEQMKKTAQTAGDLGTAWYKAHDAQDQGAGKVAAATPVIDAGAEALKRYRDALDELKQKQDEAASLAGASMKLDALNLPQMPKVEGPMTTDVSAWNAYLDKLSEVRPELSGVIGETRKYVTALEGQQAATLAAAMASGYLRLDTLATSLLGAGASAADLVSKLDTLPPSLLAAIEKVDGLEMAISALRSQAASPITLDVKVEAFSKASASIDALALRLAKVKTPQEVASWREKAQTDLQAHWEKIGQVDQFGIEMESYIFLQGYEKQVDAELDRNQQIERAREKHVQEMDRLAQENRDRAEALLRDSANVTDEEMALSKAGKYEGSPMENARRLQAIAERGFQELKVHPDWAGILGIPPEVLGGTEEALKAWAAGTRKAVVDLTRPDMIDWGAFVRDFSQGLENEAAKENTLNIAMQKLMEAGVLGGDKTAIKKKVSEYFGDVSPVDGLTGSMQGAGGKLLTALNKDLSDNESGFRMAGFTLGGTIAEAIAKGVTAGLGTLRQAIAASVAPEVAKILKEGQGASALP